METKIEWHPHRQVGFLWRVGSPPHPHLLLPSYSCFCQDVELIVLFPAEEDWA